MGCLSSGHGKKRNRQKKFNKVYHKTKRAGKLQHDDQTFNNVTTEKVAQKLKNQELNFDKPGLAQFYCLICNRYFNDKYANEQHIRGKSHKQKLKSLKKDKPFTQEEAEMAAGKGSYIKPVVTEKEKQMIEENATNLEKSDSMA